jgi:HEAT repeat protein
MIRSGLLALLALSLLSGGDLLHRPEEVSLRPAQPQSRRELEQEIERQRARLSSAEVEERRDALMRLAILRRPEASRAALSLLDDPDAIVRATAASTVVYLPEDESAAALLPLLNDKSDFVRQEVCYALGEARARAALTRLVQLLREDKQAGVRGAAAVALGRIKDDTAVLPLTEVVLSAIKSSPSRRRQRQEDNPFVLRAAVGALGEIRNRAAVPGLIEALDNEQFPTDVRRQAAQALGLIGDSAAVDALQRAVSAPDPYLAQAAREALRRIGAAG